MFLKIYINLTLSVYFIGVQLFFIYLNVNAPLVFELGLIYFPA